MKDKLKLAAAIQQVKDGDDDAYRPIVDQMQRPLFAYLGRLGLDRASAEDIAQETLLRGWRHIGRFDPSRATLSTWLHAIARNLAFEALSQKARLVPAEPVALELLEGGTTPDAAFEARERDLQLSKAMRELSLDDRSALALAYSQGLDMAQAAAVEGCSEATFRVRLHRARERLKSALALRVGAHAQPIESKPSHKLDVAKTRRRRDGTSETGTR